MNRSLYPKDWETIALAIKKENDWTCEECDRPCRRPGQSWNDFFNELLSWGWQFNADDRNHPQRFTLTVSHTDHNPANCDRDNLRALCAPCHCRYDVQPFSMAIKKRLKAERAGQLTLEGVIHG
jgi:hypothetical protein